MGIFGTKVITETAAKPTFAEQMAAIKSAFKTAHENANNLHAEMEKEIENKNAQIAVLQSDIETINVTKKEAEAFMENISKFI